MKKILLFVLVFGMVYTVSAQTRHAISTKRPTQEYLMEPPTATPSDVVVDQNEAFTVSDNSRGTVTFVPIGNTGNSYGIYGNPRTYVWADPTINSIVFTHRMTGGTEKLGNSRIAYDVSTDGGATWTNNIHIYTPLGDASRYALAAGRYPQGAIINPEGNTDPANAFYTYFIATLDNTNSNWGGYGYGVNALTETDPPAPTQTNLTSGEGYWRLIPDAFHVTQQGDAWYVEPSQQHDGTDYVYTGDLILGHGAMNDDNTDVVYEEELYSFMEAGESFGDAKIAFAPDGQTGYMCFLTDAASDPVPYTSYHPVLLKTTDGGESWSDPIQVQLGGEDGIETLKNYFSDTAIASTDAYDEGFDRNEVWYNMGYHLDLAVDGQGNPYITGMIAVANSEGWYPYEDLMAEWNVYSPDGGTTWEADALWNNHWFSADIGAIAEYNRPYVSSTYDGHYLSFSWLDTDFQNAEDNGKPNIYVIGYDTEDRTYSGEADNVTKITQAWNMAFYGSQSYYVFSEEDGDMVNCEIPFVYEEFTVPGDDTQPCDFWYIKDYTMDMAVGTDEIKAEVNTVVVSQNQPNPATDVTEILITGKTNQPIQLTISNMLGQVVYTDQIVSGALVHNFAVNVSNFDSGIYLYTVRIGNQTTTKKMLVK